MKKFKILIQITGIIITLAMIFSFIYGVLNYSSIKIIISETVVQYGLVAMLISSFLLDLFPQYLSAHNIILIGAILKMNMVVITSVVTFGTILASIAGFFIGKGLEEDLFIELFKEENYKKIKKYMNKNGRIYVGISAVSPLPYIPIIFGGLGMSFKEFVIYGIIPRVAGFIVTGLAANYIVSLLGTTI